MGTYERWKEEQTVLERLQAEICRLAESERFSESEVALEALQAVSCWAMEEQVEPMGSGLL